MSEDMVKAWSDVVSIPTYGIGQPDRNPMFLEKRVYQGSSGVVYPYPVIDRVFDEKFDKAYTAVFLENRYLKIMILPELGGRVQMALDKTNNYHFIYYNQVIKPALVGLTGPWISGGIEFNWPQHHRPSTFEPVDWRIETEPDGSATVWCSEIERMFFTKGMHGFRLQPDRACLEIRVQLYNRTSEPQTFLWWANPAVHVNDDYQSVFPPDVHAVMDHGKRDVSDFPIATGTYYKVNYAPGTDISRYKNIKVPMSYMAYRSDFDFVGDYDHGRQAGMLHVADHHLVPGKKQWTWGGGDFGLAWDRQLTDSDGPYIELMCGAFTDNQPDFSWIMPGEEKRFTQVFMPYKNIGPATNASTEAVISLALESGTATVGVYVTSPRNVRAELEHKGARLWERTTHLSPEQTLVEKVAVPDGAAPTDIRLRVCDADSNVELLAFAPLPDDPAPIPSPATPAKAPGDIGSNEELFLNGLHLEQYRHATYPPEPYYEEALRRDPFDSRCSNAMGLLLFRRGRFADAEPYFRKAIEGLTRRNPNPYDGEPYYNLGLALKMQGRYAEAFDAFYKSVWSAAWGPAAFYELACLAARRGAYGQALELAQSALSRNGLHHKARHLKVALLRRLGRSGEAKAEAETGLTLDILDLGLAWELKLLAAEPAGITDSTPLTPLNDLSIAIDYSQAGLFSEAAQILSLTRSTDPLHRYFRADCEWQSGAKAQALQTFKQAAAMPPDFCFPHRLESVDVLSRAQAANPADARAPYYLGNFWYAHRRYAEAIAAWEKARGLDPEFATVHRNLGLAYFNKLGKSDQALDAYEQAFSLNQDDARVFYELDQLHKRLNSRPQDRLSRLEMHRSLVDRRDDLTIEYITLLNMAGRAAEALRLLLNHQFHPWEGGEGKVTGQYVVSLVALAQERIAQGRYDEAVKLLSSALTYPHNLGEGKLPAAQENNIFYYLGIAHAGGGDAGVAQSCFEKAATGLSEPTSAMYYNDQPPDMIFYQGLACLKLNRTVEARQIFQKLVDYGRDHLDDAVSMDYFAVSLPTFLVFEEDLTFRNRIHCHYMLALGHLGLGEQAEARLHFDQALTLDSNHQGARLHRTMLAAG